MQIRFGPEKRKWICRGFYVLIGKDLRKRVVFFGHRTQFKIGYLVYPHMMLGGQTVGI